MVSETTPDPNVVVAYANVATKEKAPLQIKTVVSDWLSWDNPNFLSDILSAVYMRVSTDDQEEEGTINGQWLELKARILADGVSLPKENIYVDDGWSGGFLKRPDLDRLRNDAKDGKLKRLYVYDRGRLSRVHLHQEIVLDELRKLGVEIIELHGMPSNTPEGAMMGSVMGIFHEYERTKILERFRLGRLRIVKKDREVLGYSPCYGYNLHKTNKERGNKQRAYFTINPEQEKVVKYIFEMVADGKNIAEVQRQLYKDGIKTMRTDSCEWSYATLYKLVRNTTYIGKHYYNKLEAVETTNPQKQEKYSKVLKGSFKQRPESEWWQVDGVPAIIDEDLFNRVQAQLKKNAKHQVRNTKKRSYLVAGLIKCGCGRVRTGDPTTDGYAYYRCKRRDKGDVFGERNCFSRGINVTVFDAQVWHKIRELLTQPKLIAQFTEKLLDGNDDSYKDKLKRLKQRLKKLDEEYDRYIDGYGKGFISEEKLKVKTNEVKKLKAELEAEATDMEKMVFTKPEVTPEVIASNMERLLGDDCPFEKKQAIARSVIDEVIATSEEATITGKIPVFDESCFLGDTKTNIRNEKKADLFVHESDTEESTQSFFTNNNLVLKIWNTYPILSNPSIRSYIPFKIKIRLPKSDRGNNYGYSKERIIRLLERYGDGSPKGGD